MEAVLALALGIAAAVAALAVAMRRRRARGRAPGTTDSGSGPVAGSPPSGPTRLAPTRIVVVGGPRPSTGLRPDEPARRLGPGVSPRRRLLRDASAVLFGIAAIALTATVLSTGAAPAGDVLSATGTPATGRASDGRPGDLATARPISPGTARPEGGNASPSAGRSPSVVAPSGPAGRPSAGGPVIAATPPATPGASATPDATGRPAAGAPSAGRLALLTPCPGRSDCYLYVVRRGDTLYRIASFFGIAPETILRLNPAITDPSIVVRGSRLVLPTPTR